MKKIRFGITGSGYMGRTHAEAIKHLSASGELVAIWGGTRAAALEPLEASGRASVEYVYSLSRALVRVEP